MTFKNWMKRNYISASGPRGKLARDIRDDEKFPINGTSKFDAWRVILRSHLVHHDACDDCLDTFDACWKEYELCERKRLNMHLSGV